MDIKNYHLTRHAIDRALDMGVTAQEIRECLMRPAKTKRSGKYPGCTNYLLGRIVCAVDPDKNVTTILWASAVYWKADLEIAPFEGREFRERERVNV